jgi:hypothetical protein
VFEDALLYGLIRGNRAEEARGLLTERLDRRPSVRESRLLESLG